MLRRLVLPITFIIAGTFAGLLLASFIGQKLQMRHGERELEAYAQRLIRSGAQLSLDADEAHSAMTDPKVSFCSEAEIALMRKVVFGSHTIKAIERIRENRVECTAALGRLPVPLPVEDAGTQTRHLKVYASRSLPNRGDSPSQVLQTVIVMNPVIFQDLDEPPMVYAGRFRSTAGATSQGVIAGTFGRGMPISDDEVVAGTMLQRGDFVYLPRCAPEYSLCVIAAEPVSAMNGKASWIVDAALLIGGFGGACLSAVPVLFMRRQRTLANQLRRAIRAGEIRMVYQPVVDFSTGAIVGAEALVRWRDESDELVRPEIFIAIAEDRGFIEDITRYAVCHTLAELHGPLQQADFRVSINISSQDLANSSFCDWLTHELSLAGIHASAIALEITERSTIQAQAAIAIAQLHDAGHAIYLDDFGTGYSSLSYLHQLKLSTIKIDRAFTRTIGTESVTATVVPQILSIASQLELSVVVEGVETAAQAAYFRAQGPGILGQGYYLGRPVPADEFKELLDDAA